VSSTPDGLLVLAQSHLKSGKDSQEVFVVDSKLVVLPEAIDEVVECLVVNVQLQAVEDVLEVLSGDKSRPFRVDDFEEVCHALDAGFVGSLDHLVNDVLVRSSALHTVSFELADEFTVVDGTTMIRI
jgi:hypothetical protein